MTYLRVHFLCPVREDEVKWCIGMRRYVSLTYRSVMISATTPDPQMPIQQVTSPMKEKKNIMRRAMRETLGELMFGTA